MRAFALDVPVQPSPAEFIDGLAKKGGCCSHLDEAMADGEEIQVATFGDCEQRKICCCKQSSWWRSMLYGNGPAPLLRSSRPCSNQPARFRLQIEDSQCLHVANLSTAVEGFWKGSCLVLRMALAIRNPAPSFFVSWVGRRGSLRLKAVIAPQKPSSQRSRCSSFSLIPGSACGPLSKSSHMGLQSRE